MPKQRATNVPSTMETSEGTQTFDNEARKEKEDNDGFIKALFDLHGVNELHHAFFDKHSRSETLIWLLVFSIALVMLVWFVIQACVEFFTNPIVTSYRIQSNASGMHFPTVYLCPTNAEFNYVEVMAELNRTWYKEHAADLLRPGGNSTQGFIFDISTVGGALVRLGYGFSKLPGPKPESSNCPNPSDKVTATYSFYGKNNETINVKTGGYKDGEQVRISCYNSTYQLARRNKNMLEPWDHDVSISLRCNGSTGEWIHEKFNRHWEGSLDFDCVKVWTPSSAQDYYLRAGYPQFIFLQQCAFGGRGFECSRFVTEVFDRDRGKCFKLDVPYKQTTPGLGLVLQLNMELGMDRQRMRETIADEEDPRSPYKTPYDAVHVSLHDSNSFTSGSLSASMLRPGTYVKADIDSVFYSILERKVPVWKWTGLSGKQRCVPNDGDEDLKVIDVKNAHGYSLLTCQFDCAAISVINKCNCMIAIDDSFVKKDIKTLYHTCTPMQMSKCAFQSDRDNEIKQCVDHCLPACTHWHHKLTMSSTFFQQFPGKVFTDVYDGDERNPYISAAKSMDKILLELSYADLQYTLVEEEYVMTFNNFVGGVGGLFGLWLGPSLVTLFKIIFSLVKSCCCRYRRKTRQ